MTLARDTAAEDPAVAGAHRLATAPRAGFWRRWRWPLMIGGPAIILAVAAWFVLTSGRVESTDDAYVQRAKAPVSAAIAGRVVEIDVTENQHVKAGQVLFKLDPSDEIAEARRADAALAAARLQVSVLQDAVTQQKVSLASALQTQTYADREAARQRALAGAGVASRQQVDEAQHSAQLARDQVAMARQGVATALANLGGATRRPDVFPGVLQAGATRQASLTNLSRTVVTAPVDGVVTRVDQLQLGAYVDAAQTVFYLLSGEPWVEANFKENQLAKMRVGQSARIQIDAYGGTALAGQVASFSPGSGSSFSPLPAQNATGNWVKVVQRLPVRIAFDKPPPAAARDGLSAKVTVDIRRP
ncbi:MAG: HlyD family secretion protein [Caulobacteraceae bacterium]